MSRLICSHSVLLSLLKLQEFEYLEEILMESFFYGGIYNLPERCFELLEKAANNLMTE